MMGWVIERTPLPPFYQYQIDLKEYMYLPVLPKHNWGIETQLFDYTHPVFMEDNTIMFPYKVITRNVQVMWNLYVSAECILHSIWHRQK